MTSHTNNSTTTTSTSSGTTVVDAMGLSASVYDNFNQLTKQCDATKKKRKAVLIEIASLEDQITRSHEVCQEMATTTKQQVGPDMTMWATRVDEATEQLTLDQHGYVVARQHYDDAVNRRDTFLRRQEQERLAFLRQSTAFRSDIQQLQHNVVRAEGLAPAYATLHAYAVANEFDDATTHLFHSLMNEKDGAVDDTNKDIDDNDDDDPEQWMMGDDVMMDPEDDDDEMARHVATYQAKKRSYEHVRRVYDAIAAKKQSQVNTVLTHCATRTSQLEKQLERLVKGNTDLEVELAAVQKSTHDLQQQAAGAAAYRHSQRSSGGGRGHGGNSNGTSYALLCLFVFLSLSSNSPLVSSLSLSPFATHPHRRYDDASSAAAGSPIRRRSIQHDGESVQQQQHERAGCCSQPVRRLVTQQ